MKENLKQISSALFDTGVFVLHDRYGLAYTVVNRKERKFM